MVLSLRVVAAAVGITAHVASVLASMAGDRTLFPLLECMTAVIKVAQNGIDH